MFYYQKSIIYLACSLLVTITFASNKENCKCPQFYSCDEDGDCEESDSIFVVPTIDSLKAIGQGIIINTQTEDAEIEINGMKYGKHKTLYVATSTYEREVRITKPGYLNAYTEKDLESSEIIELNLAPKKYKVAVELCANIAGVFKPHDMEDAPAGAMLVVSAKAGLRMRNNYFGGILSIQNPYYVHAKDVFGHSTLDSLFPGYNIPSFGGGVQYRFTMFENSFFGISPSLSAGFWQWRMYFNYEGKAGSNTTKEIIEATEYFFMLPELRIRFGEGNFSIDGAAGSFIGTASSISGSLGINLMF